MLITKIRCKAELLSVQLEPSVLLNVLLLCVPFHFYN